MTPYDQAPPASPQSGEPDADLSALKRSGSQKRQRSKKLQIVLTPQQYDEVKTRAAAAGMSASDWGYTIIFGSPGPRARRRPTLHARALGLATAALNQLGNNFNQIAHKLNAGGAFSLAGPYSAALADVRRTLHTIREAAAGRASDCDDNQGQPAQ
jgi:hypothetical protein